MVVVNSFMVPVKKLGGDCDTVAFEEFCEVIDIHMAVVVDPLRQDCEVCGNQTHEPFSLFFPC